MESQTLVHGSSLKSQPNPIQPLNFGSPFPLSISLRSSISRKITGLVANDAASRPLFAGARRRRLVCCDKRDSGKAKGRISNHSSCSRPGVDDSKRDLFKKHDNWDRCLCSLRGDGDGLEASDIVLKKMCYLYVGNYAKVNPDLALLAINSLQRDCKDEEPMIRGPVLKDNNGYVRMVAVMGVLKLYHISASTCVDSEFPATLKYLMLIA